MMKPIGSVLDYEEFVDSVVYCDYCTVALFVRSRVYSYGKRRVFRESIVYGDWITPSTFYDSVVACDYCAGSEFHTTQVRLLNFWNVRSGVYAKMYSSRVECAEPLSAYCGLDQVCGTADDRGYDTLCGNLDACSCCLGPGCALFPDKAPKCNAELCQQLKPPEDSLVPEETSKCTNERNPYCVLGEPYCEGDSIRAFWGDPALSRLMAWDTNAKLEVNTS